MKIYLARNIKFLRLKKRLSKPKLAKLLNIRRQTIHSWETTEAEPRLKVIIKLSQVFKISIDKLIFKKLK